MAEEQNKQIFRQESLDRISSPEQLTDYLHVTNPGIWIVFAIILLLLIAFFAWASVGQLETLTEAKVIAADGTAQIVVTGAYAGEVTAGMTVRAGGCEFAIASVEEDELGRTVAYAPVELANGSYDAEIVLESISPISFFLTN